MQGQAVLRRVWINSFAESMTQYRTNGLVITRPVGIGAGDDRSIGKAHHEKLRKFVGFALRNRRVIV